MTIHFIQGLFGGLSLGLAVWGVMAPFSVGRRVLRTVVRPDNT